ncbi:long-chain-fatty-acid--CoA ligase [Kocuria sp. SM24M-10]|uniref:long-chain-fatty-acid--CoA ligase n=1 Tax=Kocuria sp. SM24M-10 TaxID=1660349 RepID=UPI00064931E7|nr:long-chain-fatty-acid--CoA ligase [Kocuria sp. SM24M-10]KLU08806.1 long-chain fatty acid--CoA ligase [Kocuria sp. SM24M-10]
MPAESARDFLRARPWTASYDPGVPADLDLPETSLAHMLERSVARHGRKTALEFFGARTSYADLGRQVERAAEGLRRLGVRHGDRVALVLPNCPQHIVAFYAVLRLGAVVVEHNPLYTAHELRHQFEDHGARVAIVWDRAAERVRSLGPDLPVDTVVAVDITAAMPLAQRMALRLPLPAARASRAQLTGPAPGTMRWRELLAADPIAVDHPRPTAHDLALLQYTSGTTGLPKGAMLTHRNLESNALMGRHWLGSTEHEVVHGVLPLFHAFGLTLGVTFAMSLGAELVLFPTVRTDLVLGAMKRSRPTVLPAVPPVYEKLLDAAQEQRTDLRGISVAVSGAMSLPVPLVERWEQATGGILIEGYGLTECSPLVACNPLNDSRRAGSIGVPFPSTDIRLVDPETLEDVPRGHEGELWVRGPQVFQGYWRRPDETARALSTDGWLRTGDIVTVDDAGFLRVVDRLKEVVITGGFNVAPTEVENALRRHEDVEDAAVVGLTDPRGTEVVVAAVVLAPGRELDEGALREHCYAEVTRYKVPRRIVAVDELPRTMLGKVQRREVRRQLERTGVRL